MKKTYEKPILEMEQFSMDIEIAVSGNLTKEMFESYKIAYVAAGGDPFDKDAFNEYLLLKCGYDNSTSGYCYHTVAQPS